MVDVQAVSPLPMPVEIEPPVPVELPRYEELCTAYKAAVETRQAKETVKNAAWEEYQEALNAETVALEALKAAAAAG